MDLKSRFQDCGGGGVLSGMAQRDVQFAATSEFQQREGLVMQDHERFTAFPALDFDIVPAKVATNAGSKSFGNGLLGGETDGEERAGVFMREAIFDLGWEENAVHEALAESFEGGTDSVDFDNISADPENHGWGSLPLRGASP